MPLEKSTASLFDLGALANLDGPVLVPLYEVAGVLKTNSNENISPGGL